MSATLVIATPETVRHEVLSWRRHLHQHVELSFHAIVAVMGVYLPVHPYGGYGATFSASGRASARPRFCGASLRERSSWRQ